MKNNEAPSIRRLGRSDSQLMDGMLTLFAEAFDEPDTYSGSRPRKEYQQDLLGNDDFVALVAIDGDKVVGGLAAYVLRKFEQERSEVYVYDLAVASSSRRQGIATAMIDGLKKIAVNRGAWTIFIQADQGDDAAIALYDKLGTREEVLHFDIDVGRG